MRFVSIGRRIARIDRYERGGNYFIRRVLFMDGPLSVYVDDVRHQFGRMIMCHLWADSLDELLQMVDTISVDRKWIQGHQTLSFGKHKDASWVHFDIAISKKTLALNNGAILTDKYGPVLHTTHLRLRRAILNNDTASIVANLNKIQMIERLRNDE